MNIIAISNHIGASRSSGGAETAFVFTVQTDNVGTSAADQFTIPTTGTGYNYDISTSDGQSINGNTGNTTITFPSAGSYDVKIEGDFPRIYFNNTGDSLKLTDIKNWGITAWTSMSSAFSGCNSLTVSATDAPNLSGTTIINSMFSRCNVFNSSINHWDVSTITDMGGLFYDCFAFNQPLNNWDVSNVGSMGAMFRGFSGNTTFNQDISGWDTSSVTRMDHMFSKSQFNQPIGSWDVSNVTYFAYMFSQNFAFDQPLNSWNMAGKTNLALMFHEARVFNQDLDSWDVSACTTMERMFENATLFNGNITTWNTSNVISMSSMFNMWWGGTRPFNQNLNSWDVSSVTTMNGMLAYCINYNQPMTSWNTSNVIIMSGMFHTMPNFNQDISSWDVSSVTNMSQMFERGSGFNQDISGWDVSSVANFSRFMNMQGAAKGVFSFDISGWNTSSATNFTSAFYNTSMNSNLSNWDIDQVTVFTNFKTVGDPLSTSDYDATLVSWENQLQAAYPGGVGYTPTISISFNVSQYTLGSAAEAARTSLINTYGWTITDGGGIEVPFTFTVDTALGDGLAQFTIPTTGTGYNYTVDTSDGQSITGNTGNTTITFPSTGTYTIEVTGDFPRIYFNNTGDSLKLADISKWGSIAWVDMGSAFNGCNSLTVSATDAPNLSGVTTINSMFTRCNVFNSSINHWDVSTITDMGGLFYDCFAFNQPLNNWDVSNVGSMNAMFRGFNGNTIFNQDISGWDTSSVTTMERMFSKCQFNQPIGSWDVSNVTTFASMFSQNLVFDQPLNSWNMAGTISLSSMFYEARAFNQDLDSWDVSSVISMYQLFENATLFNGNITTWNTSNVTDMTSIFNMWLGGTRPFNQNLNSWDVSSVNNMTAMFAHCINYNQPMTSWNTSNVTTMYRMFYSAALFNQPLNTWNTISVGSMNGMFYNAVSFNQPLNTWNTSNVTNMTDMFYNSIFDQDISSWNVSNVSDFRRFMRARRVPYVNLDVSGWVFRSAGVNANGMFAYPAVAVYNTAFPTGIDTWTTTGMTNIGDMFVNSKLTGTLDISGWDVSNVTDMSYALHGLYNPVTMVSLSGWNTSNVTNMTDLFRFFNKASGSYGVENWDVSSLSIVGLFLLAATPLTTAEYDALLVNWEAQAPSNAVTINFGVSTYTLGSAAETARTSLINTYGWTITDGGGI